MKKQYIFEIMTISKNIYYCSITTDNKELAIHTFSLMPVQMPYPTPYSNSKDVINSYLKVYKTKNMDGSIVYLNKLYIERFRIISEIKKEEE